MLVVSAAWALSLSAADALVKNLLPVGLAPCCSPLPSSVAVADAAPASGMLSIVCLTFLTTLLSGDVFLFPSSSLLPSPPNLSPFSDITMAEHSDSEISLSDDEVSLLLEADEVPGAGFTATYRGGAPFQFGSDPRWPVSKDVQEAVQLQVVSSNLFLLVVLTN